MKSKGGGGKILQNKQIENRKYAKLQKRIENVEVNEPGYVEIQIVRTSSRPTKFINLVT